MTPETEFLLIDDVARICRTSPETVRFWIKTGRLRSIKPARRRLIARSDFQRFIEGKTARTRPRREGSEA
jgi:excisionase family DNA binding protein